MKESLRDQLVCRVADPVIQRQLLGETDLDFKKDLQLALAMESAAASKAQFNSAAHDTTLSVVYNVTTKQQSIGRRNHLLITDRNDVSGAVKRHIK